MANIEVLQLDIWKGDWGLPSINVECLQVLVCIRCTGYNMSMLDNELKFIQIIYFIIS